MRDSTDSHSQTRKLFNKKIYNPKVTDRNSNNSVSSFNKTYMTNKSKKSSNINSSLEFKFNSTKYIFRDSSMNYDDLKPDSDIALRDYKYDSIAKNNEKLVSINSENKLEKIFEKEYDDLYRSNKDFLRTMHHKKLESAHPDYQTKICVNLENYHSPLRSFSTIKKNEVIFGSMVKNYHEVQKHKYNDYMKQIDELATAKKPNFRKIKITSIAPKNNIEYKVSQESQLASEQNNDKNCKLIYVYF